MRILVVNVNTTESMTEGIADQARRTARPGTEIVGLTPTFGAESVEGNLESYLAAVAVMDRVLAYDQPFDAVIQAGYGEHGREGLQELLEVPVVDITEAAASTAMYLGHRYSVVTTLDRAVPLIEDRLLLAGLDRRCASVRASGMAVLELESEPERAVAHCRAATHGKPADNRNNHPFVSDDGKLVNSAEFSGLACDCGCAEPQNPLSFVGNYLHAATVCAS